MKTQLFYPNRNMWLRIKTLSSKRELRFLAVGAFNTAFNWGVFVAFQLLLGKSNYLYSLINMYILGSIVGFFLYRKIVFKVSGNVLKDFGKYQLVSIGPFFANLLLLPIFVQVLGLGPVVAQTIFVIIITLWSYFGHRFYSFKRKSDSIP